MSGKKRGNQSSNMTEFITLESLKAELTGLRNSIKTDLENQLASLVKKIDEQNADIASLKDIVRKQQYQLLQQDRKERENNLILSGIQETSDHTQNATTVNDIVNSLSVGCPIVIKSVHRLGKKNNNGHPRLLKVTVDSRTQRNA